MEIFSTLERQRIYLDFYDANTLPPQLGTCWGQRSTKCAPVLHVLVKPCIMTAETDLSPAMCLYCG